MDDSLNAYRVRIAKLKAIRDHDHMQIKRMQQELRVAIVTGTGMDRILRCCKDLITTTLLHFESEERAMDEGSPADQSAHQELHAQMIEALEEISKDLEHRQICGAIELLKFFDGRLAYHLAVEDAI